MTPSFIYKKNIPQRLDSAIADSIESLSRSKAKWLITEGHVKVDNTPCTNPSFTVKADMQVDVTIPEAPPSELIPWDLPLDILFEDRDMLVINKPAGLTVHPAAGHAQDTLVNALLHHCGDSLSTIGDTTRPGIVHRLDKDTSGLMVVAKHDEAHRKLAAQLADRSLSREYQALCWGLPIPAEGTIDAPIGRHPVHRKKMAVVERGGRHAVTHYRLLKTYSNSTISHITCKLDTGRTHQIRVHMAHIGHPLLGDPVYGTGFKSKKRSLPLHLTTAIDSLQRQALHAWRIGYIHPMTGERQEWEAPLPDDMQALLDLLLLEGTT